VSQQARWEHDIQGQRPNQEEEKMNEYGVRILLAEYDRLAKLYTSVRESSRHVVQLYFALVTGGVAALVAFDSKGCAILMTSLILLVLGLLSFMWLLSLEAWRLKIFKGLDVIRRQFIVEDPDIAASFLEDLAVLARDYDRWASPKGVLRRAFRWPGDKAPVAFLNCLLTGVLMWYACHFVLAVLIVPPTVFFIHVFVASWSYRKQRDLFPHPSSNQDSGQTPVDGQEAP
jgi:hypothetical protein